MCVYVCVRMCTSYICTSDYVVPLQMHVVCGVCIM